MELTAIPPSTHLHTLAAAADPALRTSRPSEAVEETAQTTARRGSRPSSQPLSDQETQARVRELAKRDREVRAHEQAHASVGGAYASSPRFQYERGPNGVRYAVSGHVNIDVSTVPGDPQATLAKMLVVQRAALAPVGPSNADRAVAARAARQAAEARSQGASVGDIRSLLKLHEFVAKKLYSQCGKFDAATLRRAYDRLYQTDFKLKSKGLDDALVMERLVMELCGR